MNIDSDRIIAQEYAWINQHEPTFQVIGNAVEGKVGRTNSGDSIRIRIVIPEFYPIIRPKVKVLNMIDHPNISADQALELQLLDEWQPVYRLKDVIANTRRLFIRSKKSIVERAPASTARINKTDHLEREISELQKEIAAMNSKITELKTQKHQQAGVETPGIGGMKISKTLEHQSHLLALEDLLELLTIKFEEADIDQVDFFRLYRRYIKEKYILAYELNQLKGNKNELQREKKEEKRPIAN